MRDFITKRPAIVVRKLNKTITIPAFSVACGNANSSGDMRPTGGSIGSFNMISSTIADITNEFTIEAWVKLRNYSQQGVGTYYTVVQRRDNTYAQWILGITNDGTITFGSRIGGDLVYRSSLGEAFPIMEWTHICITIGTHEGTGGRFCVYRNGILIQNSTSAGVLDAIGVNPRFVLGDGSSVGGTESLNGWIKEVCLWSISRRKEDVLRTFKSPRTTIDSNVKGLWKFNGVDGALTFNELVKNEQVSRTSSAKIVTSEYPILKYGASRIVRKFTVIGTTKCSILNFIKPTNPDHCMCVLWTDDNGKYIRRKLYSAKAQGLFEVESIRSGEPVAYNGEPLSITFWIEIWSVDGRSTSNLASDFVIPVSITSDHTSPREHDRIAYITPVGTNDLAKAFPVLNPFIADKAQTYY